jgi:hypothetical protein
LRDNFVVPHDRPGDQMREQRDEQSEDADVVVRRRAPKSVNEIGDKLEGVEADADRQHQRGLANSGPSPREDRRAKSIYLNSEHSEIGEMANCAASATLAAGKLGQQPGDDSLADQSGKKRNPTSREEQRRRNQPPFARGWYFAA